MPSMRSMAGIALFTVVTSLCSAQEGGWENLGLIRRDRSYTVVMRDRACVSGLIAAVDDGSVTIRAVPLDGAAKEQQQTVPATKVQRSDVVRVSDNSSGDPHDSLYSGRSSWADVMGSRPGSPEWLKIIRKNGREQQCKQPKVLDDRITCGGGSVTKSEINRVYYVRLKPASDEEIYLSQEGAQWLAPRTWFNYLLLGRMNVLLYDSTAAEDNAPATCNPRQGTRVPRD